MKRLVSLFLLTVWLAGIYFAHGFWSTFFAILFPIWSFYLVVERFLIWLGV